MKKAQVTKLKEALAAVMPPAREKRVLKTLVAWTPEELGTVRLLADAAGMPLAAMVRSLALVAARALDEER